MITLQSGLTISNRNFSIVLSHQKPSRVIIAVPHDGLISNDLSGMFQARTFGVKGRDKHVWPIVNDIVKKSLESGIRIDAVRFLMPRAYVDANREMFNETNLDPDTLGQSALDDLLLVPTYQYYHTELGRLVKRSIKAFGVRKVIVIDMHGFGRQPKTAPSGGYDIIIGTANKETIRHGKIDCLFAEFMKGRGYSVFLPKRQPISPEGDHFSAGHTTRLYAKKHDINAMQIEIFSKFRRREGQKRGEKLAADMAEFFSKRYK